MLTRKTGEGAWWPLLTFETKVNGDSQNTNECFYGCVDGFVVPITSDFWFASAAVVGPAQGYILCEGYRRPGSKQRFFFFVIRYEK